MAFHYNESRSEIMEQLMSYIFAYDKSEWKWDFTSKEERILSDVFETISELQSIFIPFRDRLERYFLVGEGGHILMVAYAYALNKGYDFNSIEDFCDYLLTLTAEEIDYCLRLLLVKGKVEDYQDKDYFELLDSDSKQPKFSWHVLAYSRYPLETMKESIALLKELIPLYQPYLEKGREERGAYARSFSIGEFLEMSSVINVTHMTFFEEEVDCYILSPWFIRFMLISDVDNFTRYKHFIFVSCRIDQLLLSHEVFDDDNFSAALKSLSDLSRYKVLVALTKPNVKSKDIAESLGITSAAVSFHRQKLINAQLLVVNSEDKSIKYDANKELLISIIDRLKRDFNIE